MYTDIMFAQVPLDNEAFKASPVPDDVVIPIFASPARPNSRIEVCVVALTWHVVPIDGTDAITFDLVFHDASADADTVLKDDYNAKSTNTALVADEAETIWQGAQQLDPGDTLKLAFTITSPDTAGMGGLATIGYRVKEYNGQ